MQLRRLSRFRPQPLPHPRHSHGPRRQQRPHGIPGPRAGRAELAFSRFAPLSVMALLALPVLLACATSAAAVRLHSMKRREGGGETVRMARNGLKKSRMLRCPCDSRLTARCHGEDRHS